jgi:hypothetical protein
VEAAAEEPQAPVAELSSPIEAAPEISALAEEPWLEAAALLEVEETTEPEVSSSAVEPVPAERDAQLAELLEKLAFYEAFDSLIQDNISRSADLFRSLYEERERVRAEAAGHRAEIEATATLEAERALYVERERYQNTLMSLMDDASGMQRQIDGLIQRIADAISAAAAGGSAAHEPALERIIA